MLITSVTRPELKAQLLRQLNSFFSISNAEIETLNATLDTALLRMEKNLAGKINQYMGGGKMQVFNVLHTAQYMIFLYYLSNSAYKDSQDSALAGKLYYLNKIMHGVDLFYEIELPECFGAEHPVGSVMGRATYGNDFYFYQGCTVGITNNRDGSYNHPVIGENVCMYPNSSILGKCMIGSNVNIGAGAIVKNQDVPDNSTVFGQSPNLLIKEKYTKYY